MTIEVFSELLSDIQLIQDELSEKLEVFLVLIDQNLKEATLPSKLPLICYENVFTDEKCEHCMADVIKNYDRTNNENIYKCHKGLYYSVIKTRFSYINTLYLICGRTTNLSKLKSDLCLLKPIFNLPVNFIENYKSSKRSLKNTSRLFYGLTQQELIILSLLVDGLSNKDIADKLCVSLSTVKTHIAHILNKLKVSNRTEASIFAIKEGLIEKSK